MGTSGIMSPSFRGGLLLMAIGQVTAPFLPGYAFGVGADLATGSPMGKTSVQRAPGATINFGLDEAGRKIREQQLEIGFLIQQFAAAVARLAKGSWVSNPLDALRVR